MLFRSERHSVRLGSPEATCNTHRASTASLRTAFLGSSNTFASSRSTTAFCGCSTSYRTTLGRTARKRRAAVLTRYGHASDQQGVARSLKHTHHRWHGLDHAILQHCGYKTRCVLRKNVVLLRLRRRTLSSREQRVDYPGTNLMVREVKTTEQKGHEL